MSKWVYEDQGDDGFNVPCAKEICEYVLNKYKNADRQFYEDRGVEDMMQVDDYLVVRVNDETDRSDELLELLSYPIVEDHGSFLVSPILQDNEEYPYVLITWHKYVDAEEWDADTIRNGGTVDEVG